MVRLRDIRRVDFGYFVRPAEETAVGRARVEPVLGYAVVLDSGVLLFDTGMGRDRAVDEHYRPVRRPLPRALGEAGVDVDDVTAVVNCHLHFDHCGGNPGLTGRPVYVQRAELADARTTPHYTLPPLVDFPGAQYEQLDGDAEIAPGVWLLPTPGHTRGHQSLAVRCADGTVVLAGQSHDTASAYTADHLAHQAHADAVRGPLPDYPSWIARLTQFDPARVLFAHDQSVWEPTRRRP